jgi:hypothetical protein
MVKKPLGLKVMVAMIGISDQRVFCYHCRRVGEQDTTCWRNGWRLFVRTTDYHFSGCYHYRRNGEQDSTYPV